VIYKIGYEGHIDQILGKPCEGALRTYPTLNRKQSSSHPSNLKSSTLFTIPTLTPKTLFYTNLSQVFEKIPLGVTDQKLNP